MDPREEVSSPSPGTASNGMSRLQNDHSGSALPRPHRLVGTGAYRVGRLVPHPADAPAQHRILVRAPAVQHPWPGRRGTPGRPCRARGTSARRRSLAALGQPTITTSTCWQQCRSAMRSSIRAAQVVAEPTGDGWQVLSERQSKSLRAKLPVGVSQQIAGRINLLRPDWQMQYASKILTLREP